MTTTTKPITAEQIQALRRRHGELQRKAAELAGRRDHLLSQQKALASRMQAEFGADSLDELHNVLSSERAALEEEYQEAERLIGVAERLL